MKYFILIIKANIEYRLKYVNASRNIALIFLLGLLNNKSIIQYLYIYTIVLYRLYLNNRSNNLFLILY